MNNHFEILTAENAINLKGGHKGTFCVNVEIKQCMVIEGKYCGPKDSQSISGAEPTEISGPVNPWGK